MYQHIKTSAHVKLNASLNSINLPLISNSFGLWRMLKTVVLVMLLMPLIFGNDVLASCDFSDVDESEPSYNKAIQFLCNKKIVKGSDDDNKLKFNPNNSITRLELSKIAVLSKAIIDGENLPDYRKNLKKEANKEANKDVLNKFKDKEKLTKDKVWDDLGDIIYYVSKEKIIQGRGCPKNKEDENKKDEEKKDDKCFEPNKEVTRGEAIKIFATILGKPSKASYCSSSTLPYKKLSDDFPQYGFCPHINTLYQKNILKGLVRGNEDAISKKYFNSYLRRGEMAILACNAIAIAKNLDITETCLSDNASCFLDQSIVGEKFIYNPPADGDIFADAVARVFLHWSDECEKNWAVVTPAPKYSKNLLSSEELLSSSAKVTDNAGNKSEGASYICQNKEGLDSICSPFIKTKEDSCADAIGTIAGYTEKAIQAGCDDDANKLPSQKYIHIQNDADAKKSHTLVFYGNEEIGRFYDNKSNDGRYTYTDPSDTLTSKERGGEDRYNCDISLEDFKAAFNIPDYDIEYGIPCRYERKNFVDYTDESRKFFKHEAVLFININTQKKTATAWFKSPDYEPYWATQADIMAKLENAGLNLSDNPNSFYFSPAVATFLWYNNPEGLFNSVSTVYYEPSDTGGRAHIVKNGFLKTLIKEGFNADEWCKVVSKETISQCGDSSKDKSIAAYLGFPTSDELDANTYDGKSGRYQNFIGGQIYKSAEGTYYVYGPSATVLNTEPSLVDIKSASGKTGSAGYGFPTENPRYEESTSCIYQKFSSGWEIGVCGDDMAGIIKGAYSIKITKTLEQIQKDEFNEGFYDTFAEIGLYGIAYEVGAELAFGTLITKIKKLPLAKRFGTTLAKKFSGKIAAKAVPGVGWVLLGADLTLTTIEIEDLVSACIGNGADGKSADYYCGKALAYGILIGALGVDASPKAENIFGVNLTSNSAINGKSKLFEKIPTINPKLNKCPLTKSRKKFPACDIFGGQKAFKDKMQKFTVSEKTDFFKDIDKLDDSAIDVISNATKPFEKAIDMSIVHDVKKHFNSAISDDISISKYLKQKNVLIEDKALSADKLYEKDSPALKPSTEFEFTSLLYRNKLKLSDKTQFKYLSEKKGYKNPDFEELCDEKVVRIFESKQIQALVPKYSNLYDNVLIHGFEKRKNTGGSPLREEHKDQPMGILLDIESPNLTENGINSNTESEFLDYLKENIKGDGIVKVNDTVTIRTKYDIYEYSYKYSKDKDYYWDKGFFDELCK